MCATKLNGAKIDGPAVAGLSFFTIRWRTKLHPETIIKVRSGLFSFVLIFFIKQKCVKPGFGNRNWESGSGIGNLEEETGPVIGNRNRDLESGPGNGTVNQNRRSLGSGAIVFRDKVANSTTS